MFRRQGMVPRAAWTRIQIQAHRSAPRPAFGDHFTGGIAFGPDGWIYVGHGTVTNSGVVGEDNFQRGWASSFPEMYDVPARDIVLAGMNFLPGIPGRQIL